MPTYSFRDKNTGLEFDEFMSMSSLDSFLENNPHIEQTITGAPALVDSNHLGIRKPDQGFRDHLRRIKKHHRRSTINTW